MDEIAMDTRKAQAAQAAVEALIEQNRPWGMPDNEFYMDRIRRQAERDVQIVLKAYFAAYHQVGASQDEGGQG